MLPALKGLEALQKNSINQKRQPMAVGCLCSHVSTLNVDQAKKMDILNRHCHEGIYYPP